MYGLNASLPKTLIQVLLRWMAQVCQDDAIREILLDVVATPISPELLPSSEEGGIAQHTEKLVKVIFLSLVISKIPNHLYGNDLIFLRPQCGEAESQ